MLCKMYALNLEYEMKWSQMNQLLISFLMCMLLIWCSPICQFAIVNYLTVQLCNWMIGSILFFIRYWAPGIGHRAPGTGHIWPQYMCTHSFVHVSHGIERINGFSGKQIGTSSRLQINCKNIDTPNVLCVCVYYRFKIENWKLAHNYILHTSYSRSV